MKQKNQAKQKNTYPALLANAEKMRHRDWVINQSRIKFNRPSKIGFTPYLRKNPGQ